MDYFLGVWDYVVVIATISISTAIGLFYAWRTRKNGNTSDFLVTGAGIKVFPLVMSSVATFLTPSTLLGTPAEIYTNGFQVALLQIPYIFGCIFAMYAVLPVYFCLNLKTVNQYIEYRFNRFLRTVPAFLYPMQYSIAMAATTYLTALVLSDATGLSYWTSVAIICGTCSLYSAMGGFSAVIWTDFLQMVVIFISLGVFCVKGTIDVGGPSRVWNLNYQGNRTVMIRNSSNNDTNYSIWSILIGGFMAVAGSVSNQSALQRQMANKKINQARMTQLFSTISFCIVNMVVAWIGLVLYARYHECDPLLNKQIRSRDQIPALFAKEIFHGIDGLTGIYIAGILAATLSTLSSTMNSFSTVVVIDFIKLWLPNVKENSIIIISKVTVLLYGAAVAALTLLVKNFGAIRQLLLMLLGASAGPSSGIFILGIFFPWATSKGATAGYFCSMAFCWWAAAGRSLYYRTSYSLLVRIDGCPLHDNNTFNQTVTIPTDSNMTLAINNTFSGNYSQFGNISSNNLGGLLQNKNHVDVFSLYTVSPLWYYGMAISVALSVGLVVSVITGVQNPETLDPRFISPLTWYILRKLPIRFRKCLGFKSKIFHGDMKLATLCDARHFINVNQKEIKILKSETVTGFDFQTDMEDRVKKLTTKTN